MIIYYKTNTVFIDLTEVECVNYNPSLTSTGLPPYFNPGIP